MDEALLGSRAPHLRARLGEEERLAVRMHLDQVLQSAAFRRSPRCCEFLTYVVEQAVDGHAELLKERAIGSALFGRKPDYETAEDSIVRVRANEVRRRLLQYYEQRPQSEVQFELSVGRYAPQITIREPVPHPKVEPLPAGPLPQARRRRTWYAAGAVVLVLIPAGLALRFAGTGPSAVERFWQPVVNSAQPALLWTSSGEFQRLPARVLHELDKAEGAPVDLRVSRREVEFIESQISSGNLDAIVAICSLLQRMGRPPQYRVGGEISLHEMGGHPLVLIGALSNPWVMQLNSSLRFQFDPGRAAILDTRTPGREWALPPGEPASGFDATVDYALVTRLFRQDTRQLLIAAGGLKHFGTGAAGEFVTNPVYWREALAQLPPDWPRRNLQVVLATRVIHKAAGPPKVVAVHWW
jgi:hypothetical protein